MDRNIDVDDLPNDDQRKMLWDGGVPARY